MVRGCYSAVRAAVADICKLPASDVDDAAAAAVKAHGLAVAWPGGLPAGPALCTADSATAVVRSHVLEHYVFSGDVRADAVDARARRLRRLELCALLRMQVMCWTPSPRDPAVVEVRRACCRPPRLRLTRRARTQDVAAERALAPLKMTLQYVSVCVIGRQRVNATAAVPSAAVGHVDGHFASFLLVVMLPLFEDRLAKTIAHILADFDVSRSPVTAPRADAPQPALGQSSPTAAAAGGGDIAPATGSSDRASVVPHRVPHRRRVGAEAVDAPLARGSLISDRTIARQRLPGHLSRRAGPVGVAGGGGVASSAPAGGFRNLVMLVVAAKPRAAAAGAGRAARGTLDQRGRGGGAALEKQEGASVGHSRPRKRPRTGDVVSATPAPLLGATASSARAKPKRPLSRDDVVTATPAKAPRVGSGAHGARAPTAAHVDVIPGTIERSPGPARRVSVKGTPQRPSTGSQALEQSSVGSDRTRTRRGGARLFNGGGGGAGGGSGGGGSHGGGST